MTAPAPNPPVLLTAPAKLTTSLRITGVRSDGYHLIEAEMVSLDLADRLELTPLSDPADPANPAGASTLTIHHHGHTVEPVAATPDNLILKALALTGRTAAVILHKHIPAGAGLGGGSSDAAAILRWAGWADAPNQSTLLRAAELGADVPFCLVGGRAKVTGIGEIVKPLPNQTATYTLLTPPFGCSTPQIYAAWDELGGPTGANGNDLEPAALAAEPRLAQYRDELAQISNQQPRLAGSGSTWFVEGAFPGPNRAVVRTAA